MSATEIIRAAGAELCHPWPRHILPVSDWAAMAAALAADPLHLLALWADTTQVHALLLDQGELAVLAASADVHGGSYPALSPFRPAAAWFERMINDLWGHTAAGGTDPRPWLDHGCWALTLPLSARPAPPPPNPEPPTFLADPDDTRMQWPIGPVHGGIAEAAHLRLTLRGDRVAHAEARLGYTHKGTLALMRGKSPRTAARFAARLAGDSTVAHSIAFARATEAALRVEAPPRAVTLRAVMAEVERVAGHLDQLAIVARAADAREAETTCGVRREWLLRATDTAFGHRLMMDCVVPGGVAGDILAGGTQELLRAMGGIATALPDIRRLFQSGVLAARLSGPGIASRADVTARSAGGVTGRASGRRFDARQFDPLYTRLNFVIATASRGDSGARAVLRLAEIDESLRLIGGLIGALPDGPTSVALPMNSGEGIGCAESIHGDIWHWLRLDHGQIAAVFPRDPGWALWPMAETVLAGAAAEDVALIRASLGLPASGMDL